MQWGGDMKRYLKIYVRLLKINFSALVVYRSNFVSDVAASLFWGIFSVISMYLLTSRVTTVYSWKREELMVLTGVYSIVIGIFHVVFSGNFRRFSRVIHLGQLDSVLIKPVDSQFLLSFYIVNYATIPRIIGGIVFVIIYLNRIGVTVNMVDIVLFSIVTCIGILLLYSVWYVIVSITIWQSNLSNITDFLFDFTSSAKYPQEMYQDLKQFVLFIFIPLTLIVTVPTKILLHRSYTNDMIAASIFAVVFFIISRKFWKFALRYYTSASS